MQRISYGRQAISLEDIEEVKKVLESDFLTQGPKVPEFEQSVSGYCHAKFGVAVNSATSALHLACRALGLGDGDLLWTSPITFVASANCALYCNATFDLVDIDDNTYNICPKQLERKLRQAKRDKTLPKIVVAVHLAGQPCDLAPISELCKAYGVHLIEDASHAIGAKYNQRPVGDCYYSDVTIFSFHPVKIITTAEGGIAVTNDESLANKMRLLRSHGITRAVEEMQNGSDGPWYYEQIELGFNYRMTELQAALGISQLKRIDQFVNKRNEIARYYDGAFRNSDIRIPRILSGSYCSFHLYVVRVRAEIRKKVFEKLTDMGIGVNLHYIPIYKHPYFSELGFDARDFPAAERYYAEAFSIPIHPMLEARDMEFVAGSLKSITKKDR